MFPPVNALGNAVCLGLLAATDAAADGDVRAMVITSKGPIFRRRRPIFWAKEICLDKIVEGLNRHKIA